MNIFKTFQGDVDIREADIPKSAKLLDTKTVMYGEETGHHHTFKSGQVLVYEPQDNDTINIHGEDIQVQKYVHVKQSAILEHQEHKQQEIPPGKYAILQEREWDVLGQQIRKVVD